ncbi:MAG: ribosome-binding factor A [Rhodospirillales bacterium 20-60-12]|nr:MAG: ribosome-binding factor A [Rhodospirillales bacterium 20-60-12]HQT66204.1 30S ribosome-binding factor RbfA [Acetobacteraceae bacterium]
MLRNRNRAGIAGRTTNQPSSQRQLRVAEELRHRLSALFTRIEFRDPELAGVRFTVSEVRATPDLKHATVFLTRLGSTEIDHLLPAVRRVAPYIRSQVSQGLRLKFVPDLHFEADHTLDYAMHITKLLRSADIARDLTPED